MRYVGGFVAVVLLLASSVASAAPLRTLVYRYNAVFQGFGTSTGYRTSDVSGSQGTYEQGTSETAGGEGTITVLVQQATQDGGLVVDVSQHVDREQRSTQTVRCAVYGNPNQVICDQNLNTSAEETALLEYLGRYFYDPSRLDAEHHWQITQSLNGGKGSLVSDYSVTSPDASANPLTISVKRLLKAWQRSETTTGTLEYDTAMSIPVALHVSTDVQDSSMFRNSVIDLHLVSDSMAPSGPANSH